MKLIRNWEKFWNFATKKEQIKIHFDLQLFSQEKTEEPTGKKLDEARSKGQVAKSADLSSVVVLFAAAYLLKFLGLNMYNEMSNYMRHVLSSLHTDITIDTVPLVFMDSGYVILKVVLPLLLIVSLTAVLVSVAQVGPLFTTEQLFAFDFTKLNPITGMGRFFSMNSLVELLKSIFKVAIVGFFVYRFLIEHLPAMPGYISMDIQDAIALTGSLIIDLFLEICKIFLILAILDFSYQKWEFMRNMKMSKQEVKDESKNSEGNPEIKGKIKQKQRAMAMQRMMQQVPEATVVVTNPTHFAVALKYEKELAAPMVVAKGQDFLAERIKAIAKEANVPVIENKPLARALYDLVEVDSIIHPDLYKAVAELLAYVYKLNKLQGKKIKAG